MDHQWDEDVWRERAAREERERYGVQVVPYDPDVARRDRHAWQRRPRNMSPWEIGASHYDQRDLYTRNARVDEGGYGQGPNTHPEEGSYAYVRSERSYVKDAPNMADESPFGRTEHGPNLYEREAWPWLSYNHQDDGLSDGVIYERVWKIFMCRRDLDASDIEVHVEDAEVTLTGTVPDRPSKRLAEDLAVHCDGVKIVHNQLRIVRDDTGIPFGALIPAL
ncbi:MAG: BON domain-containing protein [Polyangiaceae bacterium]|nr:BON domain-containing protein [Polyangiaceae bacterium]